MSTFEGIWVPLVTPFRQGKLDLYSAQQLALSLSAAGVHGLVACGTTGEAATLNEHEQDRMLCGVMEAVQHRCPVVMGVSGSDTRVVAEKIARLNALRPAGFLVSAPSYVRPSQEGIRLHFEAVANAAESPVILYNIPARTGVNIDVATVIALERHANIAAVKECGGNLAQTMELINHTDLNILCGDDALLFNTLCLGGHGAISAAAHIRPDLFVHLFELVRAGQIGPARTLFRQLLPMIQLLFSEPNPGPVKAALAMQGQMLDELRLPMTPMSAPGRLKLAKALEKLKAIPIAGKAAKSAFSVAGESRLLGLVR
ncbi:4-hydroxy-tetrahydrodipicolinate synthase [Collimonas sp. OK242]|jgi:4-hydroxy-tetrahydrodipicolinate synthase|uniref:4-hydroxy-tetrahydrodipicolinate synthase n=1 Tax=Collimonas sp. OK242 TaxID=1798195 RepID=UPI00089A45B1|nr:4-hydroxy-tetrahydrodipicolinate synthase [Collimonas sp. OK242]SDY14001.1 4-hydroxy-tetrahydrodipicolinate synthase [Collimonas sp. OK242]